MTDPMVIATAAVMVIAALGAAIVKIILALKSIHTLVNSRAEIADAKLVALELKLSELQQARVEDAQARER